MNREQIKSYERIKDRRGDEVFLNADTNFRRL